MDQASAAGYLLDSRAGGGVQGSRRVASGVLLALLICAGTRLVTWAAAYAGAWENVRITQRIVPPLEMTGGQFNQALADPESELGRAVRQRLFSFQPLLNWDAFFYRSIIETGYHYEPVPAGRWPKPEAQFNIAFFPLYPLLCAGLARICSVPVAMAAVSNLATLAAAAVFFLWVERLSGRGAALFSGAILFAWPSASFDSFGYPESLSLLLLCLTLLAASCNRWWFAALACGAATAARPTLLPLAPLLMISYLIAHGAPDGRRLVKAMGVGILGITGAAAYAAYLAYRFGSPLVYQHNFDAGWIGLGDDTNAARFWTLAEVRDGLRPLLVLARDLPLSLTGLANPMTWNMPLSLLLIGLSFAGMRRVRAEVRPWLMLAPLIFLQRYLAAGWSTFAMESMQRYVGIAAPTLALLGVWTARRSVATRLVLLMGMLLLQATFAFHFGMNEWAG